MSFLEVKTDIRDVMRLLGTRPAAIRRVLRGSLGITTRASAKRVKANIRPNRRVGQYQKAVGTKIKTYGDTVVGMVGARTGFKIIHPFYGNIDPTKYAHLLEKGRKEVRPKKAKWLKLKFMVGGRGVKLGSGYVIFRKRVGPAPGFFPVKKDEQNFATESERQIYNDLSAKLGAE